VTEKAERKGVTEISWVISCSRTVCLCRCEGVLGACGIEVTVGEVRIRCKRKLMALLHHALCS
jgi:hypothetical protein